ncbi:MAG TPA: bifunctional rhamnulose-1-phosphate aldolase/short-chain dehydrogenase [Vicinamibacterales bacterium]|nr:bifunctional rhamnulose-1-phosphate aldolase/short-chain dehydrogenase [Vicinamibacterales bacterium]
MPDAAALETKFLENLWNEEQAAALAGDPLNLLRHRSNLLGADLRITNFGGGNTSSKFDLPDPLTGEPVRAMAVKGSGGDLRSIGRSGFAVLYLDKLHQLVRRYRGEAHEDEMVACYPLCAFGDNRVAASIDTPLHAFLPFDHVDHLHPDWAIALAASANGRGKLEEFNRRFGRRIIWVPWQRPGFELAMMLKAAVADHPGCEGIVLGSHGLFTWGDTQRDCYQNSIRTIDQMGAFVDDHARRQRARFGGAAVTRSVDRDATAAAILPHLRGRVSSDARVVAHFEKSEEALEFANSTWAADLCRLGTSCPDHFLRTRISPMFVAWDPAADDGSGLIGQIDDRLADYRQHYAAYYTAYAQPDSPRMRSANPSVVVVPALGVFGFGKDKREARITTEFFLNAVHVMAGATALEDGASTPERVPQARRPEQANDFTSFHNYVALPRSEAFRIEYWALEEAKLQRLPPEREFSRKVALVVGGGSGIGREVARELARRGAHVAVADQNGAAAEATWADARTLSSADMGIAVTLDLMDRNSIAAAVRQAVLQFGGLDSIVNTAAIYPTPEPGGAAPETTWARTLQVNVTSNYVLAEEARRVLDAQQLPASIVLTSSANALVPKSGSEPYDVSKAAINHLIRELAVGLGPLVRVNGIAPATVVAGSAMFPRDRVISSLEKYRIAYQQDETTEALREKLAAFYAQRTITRRPILPEDCARAIVWLAGDASAKTTGHVIPVDGGLAEAFLR